MAKENVHQKKTSPGVIAAAWIVVCVPLAWGVYNTGANAAKLFTHAPSAAAPSPTPH